MGDIGAVVLLKLLREPDLEAWTRLKLAYFDAAYSSVFTAISTYYAKYSELPNFDSLKATTQRDGSLSRALAALETLELPDVDIDIIVDALIDQYTQDEALKLVEKFVDNIVIQDSQTIKDSLADIVLKLDEKTHTSENVVLMHNIHLFNSFEANAHKSFPLGFSNTFDGELGGAFREDLILVGGKRGAGKSIVCANLVEFQVSIGNPCVYFTIEMKAKEIFERYMSIKANVSHQSLRKGELTDMDKLALIKARADMFYDSDSLVDDYREHLDPLKFEQELLKTKELKENQLVIIDDRELSLSTIDLHLQKLKAQYKDRFKLAVIDYTNQIKVHTGQHDMYDWTTQIQITKQLKEFARKYDVAIFSPYQIDDSGGTRFAKGLLDSPDIALILDAHTKADSSLTFQTTKIRNGSDLEFTVGIDWKTLRIDPADKPSPSKAKKEKGGMFSKGPKDGSVDI